MKYDVNSRIYSDNFDNYIDVSKPLIYNEDDIFEFEESKLNEIQNRLINTIRF